jgi:hypothetical protein
MGSARNDLSLSVVMPVHNAMPHVDDAVRSILEQTHRDFELVLLRSDFRCAIFGSDVEDRPSRRGHSTGSSRSARSNTSSNIWAFSRPVFWL